MLTFLSLIFAGMALTVPMDTSSAGFADYQREVATCYRQSAIPETEQSALRAYFEFPSRRVTRLAERRITDDAATIRTCLGQLETRYRSIGRGQSFSRIYGTDSAPYLADLAARKSAAEAEARAFYVALHYVPSQARAEPVPGYFYCRKFRHHESGRNSTKVSPIQPDPDIYDRDGLDALTRVQQAYLRTWDAWDSAGDLPWTAQIRCSAGYSLGDLQARFDAERVQYGD